MSVRDLLTSRRISNATISFDERYSANYLLNIINICHALNSEAETVQLATAYFAGQMHRRDILEELYQHTPNIDMSMTDTRAVNEYDQKIIQQFHDRINGYMNKRALSTDTLEYLELVSRKYGKYTGFAADKTALMLVTHLIQKVPTPKVKKEIVLHIETSLWLAYGLAYTKVDEKCKQVAIIAFESEYTKYRQDKVTNHAITVYMLHFMGLLTSATDLRMYRIPHTAASIMRILGKMHISLAE